MLKQRREYTVVSNPASRLSMRFGGVTVAFSYTKDIGELDKKCVCGGVENRDKSLFQNGGGVSQNLMKICAF